jgi:hypothetical protein
MISIDHANANTGLNPGRFILPRVALAKQAGLLLSAKLQFVELNKC